MSQHTFARLCARLRVPLFAVGALMIVAAMASDRAVLGYAGIGVLVIALALYFRVGTVRGVDPVRVRPPVEGPWLAVNSPASRVPSHGLHAYGQTYAIDLVYAPPERPKPEFRWTPIARRARDYPGFGQPIFAAADGVVVRVHERERDHWSRDSWLALIYLFLEGTVRELTGPSRVIGNHVVLDVGGTYAVYAHLRRSSIRVRKGQRVSAGEQIAECGNSGNSTEPHLHFQVMDRPSPLVAAGLPMEFDRYEVDGDVRTGLPRNNERFESHILRRS